MKEHVKNWRKSHKNYYLLKDNDTGRLLKWAYNKKYIPLTCGLDGYYYTVQNLSDAAMWQEKCKCNLQCVGAIIGDVIGSAYEFNNTHNYFFQLMTPTSSFTDETIQIAAFMQSPTKESLVNWCKKYIDLSYGTSFRYWLMSDQHLPYGSKGNGAASRISPIVYRCKTLEEARDLAEQVTRITHDHDTALYWVDKLVTILFRFLHGEKDKSFVREYMDKGELKDYKYSELIEDTVPMALRCFYESYDFMSCLRLAISVGGDSDTVAAIACSVAEAYYGVPEYIWDIVKEKLPTEIIKVIEDFNKSFIEKGGN